MHLNFCDFHFCALPPPLSQYQKKQTVVLNVFSSNQLISCDTLLSVSQREKFGNKYLTFASLQRVTIEAENVTFTLGFGRESVYQSLVSATLEFEDRNFLTIINPDITRELRANLHS